MLSAPAHLGEVRLKSVQDILGMCQAEPLFYKLSKTLPGAGRHLLT